MKNKNTSYIHAIIALIALVFYERLGMAFIALMAPYVLYMVFKKDARFLPALMIHCSSGTSIMYAIFIGIIIFCVINIKKIIKNKIAEFVIIVLLLLLPIYIVLIVQKMTLDANTWQAALGYTRFYLAFWAFLYGKVISNTFDRRVLTTILASIVLLFLFGNILHRFSWSRLSSIFMLLSIVYGVFMIKTKYFVAGIVIVITSVPAFLFSEHGTFTSLLTVAYAIAIFFLWDKKKKAATTSVGIIPYLIIGIIMISGIRSYQTISLGDYSDKMDVSSFSAFVNRAKYKLYGDRAIFWDASWSQLMYYKPIMPLHDIPDIIATDLWGRTMEVEFGAHNSPLQLLRIFGFIMGGLLTIIYIVITVASSKFFGVFNANKWEVPLFSLAITNSIVLFLTGTMAMLPELALFTFGLMGVSYGKINDGYQNMGNNNANYIKSKQ